MWNVYSVGDGAFLASVMRSSSMFFGSGIPNVLAAIGLTVGVLYQGFRGSMSGEGISFGKILVTGLFYLLFLVPRTDVLVEDCHTGEAVAVSGVPLGPAFSASLISTLGHGVTKYVRTAFSGTESTDNGYVSSIIVLSDLRRKIREAAVLQSVNNVSGGNFEKSWVSYFRECTHTAIDLGSVGEDFIFSAEDVVRDSAFSSSAFGTMINVNGSEELLTCSEAHAKLLAYTKQVYSPALFEELEKASVNDGHGESAGGYRAMLNSAVSSLGMINTKVEDYVLSSVLLPIYIKAAKNKYLDEHAMGSALALNQTVNGINTAASIKQGVFFTVVRPLLTFFEALLFMLTPFMPLILMGTDNGLSLIAKYAGVTLWVAMWQPLTVLVNFYLESAASGSLAETGLAPSSFFGIMAVNRRLETYIALGGYLFSAVPVLAGFVLCGSGSVLSSVTSGFTAGAPAVNPHPNLEERQGVVSHGSLFSNTPFAGMSRTGASSVMSSVSLKEGFRDAVSNAESEALSAERSFGSELRNSVSGMSSTSLTHNGLESVGRKIMSTGSESYGMVNGIARNISESTGLSSADETSLRGAVGLILSGADYGTGASSGDSLLAQSAGANSTRSSVEKLSQELRRLSSDESLQAQFSQSLARDISRGTVSSDSFARSQSESRDLRSAAGRAVSYRETADRLRSFESAFGSGYSFDGVTVSKAVMENSRVSDSLMSEFARNNELSARANELQPLMERIIPDSKQARIAGELRALAERNPARAMDIIAEAFNLKGKRPGTEMREPPHFKGDGNLPMPEMKSPRDMDIPRVNSHEGVYPEKSPLRGASRGGNVSSSGLNAGSSGSGNTGLGKVQNLGDLSMSVLSSGSSGNLSSQNSLPDKSLPENSLPDKSSPREIRTLNAFYSDFIKKRDGISEAYDEASGSFGDSSRKEHDE